MWNDKAVILWENGNDCVNLGRYEQALALYDKAIEEGPGAVLIYILDSKGQTYCAMGDFEEAWKYFERTMEIDPDNAGSWSGMGEIHFHQGRHRKALEYFEKALQLNPNDEIISEWIDEARNALEEY